MKSCIVLAFMAIAACGGNGYHAQADSGSMILREPHEIQAQALLHRTIARAEKLLDHSQVPPREKMRLRQAVRAARDAQSRYNKLRAQGRARTKVMSSIAAASLALLADDVTGVGSGGQRCVDPAGIDRDGDVHGDDRAGVVG